MVSEVGCDTAQLFTVAPQCAANKRMILSLGQVRVGGKSLYKYHQHPIQAQAIEGLSAYEIYGDHSTHTIAREHDYVYETRLGLVFMKVDRKWNIFWHTQRGPATRI